MFDGRSELEEQKTPEDAANGSTEKDEKASQDVMARRK